MNLPLSSNLPIECLAASFSNVTNSYKFYWFLAILEHLREHQSRNMSVDDLLARMVAGVWYPAHYFRLSFGKQDQLGTIAFELATHGRLTTESRRAEILQVVRDDLAHKTAVGRKIRHLGDYVPYRFLRPFFALQLRGVEDRKINPAVETLAEQSFSTSNAPCLYRFIQQPLPAIEIHPAWFEYLREHLTILSGFCLWHLLNYLQRNNPNVPNIGGKLFEPQERDLRLARTFWNTVLAQGGPLNCIYSGQPIQEDFSLDHFLPWRFVTHDQLWNLIPTPRAVNSSKSDALPDPAYFDPFAQLHYQAVQIISRTPQAGRLLEDYVLLFKVSDVADFQTMEFPPFRETLRQTIAPQLQIAANMGFMTGWKYTP